MRVRPKICLLAGRLIGVQYRALGDVGAQDTDGEFLLNQTACDLRQNPRELAVLREKLYVLWGDLAEKKKEAAAEEGDLKPSNRPFECYVKEYGVDVRRLEGEAGYQRTFRLWGTRIK